MISNLLYVEDDALSRRNVALLLERLGHVVHCADTGEAALQLISSVDFNIVITDLRLPGNVNGLDILRRQRENPSTRQLILLTTFPSKKARLEAESLGALYLEKPILVDHLLAKLNCCHPGSAAVTGILDESHAAGECSYASEPESHL